MPLEVAVLTAAQLACQGRILRQICRPAVIFGLLLLLTATTGRAQFGRNFLVDEPDEPWHVSADTIIYGDPPDQITAQGHVTIKKKSKQLSADLVRLDQRTMRAFATGHVILSAGQDVLTGSSMEIDLKAETGTVYDATVFLKESHFYIRGAQIQKTGQRSYAGERVSVSTCDGPLPDWQITGRNLEVTVEGYGVVRHAALWAKKVPLLYTPYLVFPVKLKRQTGLLSPQWGISKRKGAEYIQPFFWAISDSSDATFYGHYMNKRGLKAGLEYRYLLSERSQGTLMFDFLQDRQVDDGTGNSTEDWGYSGDAALRPNKDRYWFRMKHDQALAHGFGAMLDLDLVSDQDYYREFKYGYAGFEQTRKYFYQNFGRDLEDENDPVRVNRLNLNKRGADYAFNAEARYYDNVIERRQRDTNTTLQKLPLILFDAPRQPFMDTPFFWNLESEYTHFYRTDGSRGHRMDVLPRLYLPLHWNNALLFEPSVGGRETLWLMDRFDEAETDGDRTQHRELWDARLELSTNLFRLYSWEGPNADRLRHSLRPKITYGYVPDIQQANFPDFDGTDRIAHRNLITYSITNTLSARGRASRPAADGPGEDPGHSAPAHDYRELLWFEVAQSYAFSGDVDTLAGRETASDRPFSPISADLRLTPFRYGTLQADARWSVYDNTFLDRNVALHLWDHRGDRFRIEHRYVRDSIESIYLGVSVNLNQRLAVHAEYERDIFEDQRLQAGFGLTYTSQCWSVDTRYLETLDDRRIGFKINLFGIGGLGN